MSWWIWWVFCAVMLTGAGGLELLSKTHLLTINLVMRQSAPAGDNWLYGLDRGFEQKCHVPLNPEYPSAPYHSNTWSAWHILTHLLQFKNATISTITSWRF